jgi:hypothetical protein
MSRPKHMENYPNPDCFRCWPYQSGRWDERIEWKMATTSPLGHYIQRYAVPFLQIQRTRAAV